MTRRPRRSHPDHRAGHRTARVGELIRRIIAESMEQIDDDRLAMVSVTGVDVDRDLHRAVVWFTSLGDTEEGDADIAEAFEEHSRGLRRIVGDQTRLRRTPELVFRPDTVLRSAERIERLLDGTDSADATIDPENHPESW
ncbi:MAG: 30S ribosome-binding factor RbfA [Acidimicrobiaceae bacterium]|nr:30S ribosome-binding factor RbfA [Acidimicrobiaceae bacterium]